MIDIKGNVKTFSRQMDRIQRGVLPLAIPTAINKTIAQINTQTRREIGRTLGIPQKHFKRRIKVYRANRRKYEGKNWIGTKVKIPVSSVFKSGQKQISYAKQSQLVPANKIFQAKMPTGHEGVYYRKGSKRLPIQEVAIDLSKIANPILQKWARKITNEKFNSILANDIRYRLSKR